MGTSSTLAMNHIICARPAPILDLHSLTMHIRILARASVSLSTALIMYSELAEPAAQKKGMAHVRLHTVRLAARLRRLSEPAEVVYVQAFHLYAQGREQTWARVSSCGGVRVARAGAQRGWRERIGGPIFLVAHL